MRRTNCRTTRGLRGVALVAGLGAALASAGPAAAEQPSAQQQAPANAAATPGPGQFSTPAADKKQVKITGFIARDKLIDSLALVPPPPEPGTPAFAADDAARQAAVALREKPIWKLATRDADYKSPHAVDAFACVIGVKITPEATPHLYMLLRRTLYDAGLATYKAKIHYNRTRPFVVARDATICSPDEAEFLSKDGSYPSGHSAFGWAWALILAEMMPDRTDAIIQRGFQFGQNRVQCGVHWQSDVNAGRVVASAVVAQLHTNADFIAEFNAAKKEVEAARAANKDGADCALEKSVTTAAH